MDFGLGAALRERDCSARMSAAVTSGGASKRDGEVGCEGRCAERLGRVRRRSARLGMSSGILDSSVVLPGMVGFGARAEITADS